VLTGHIVESAGASDRFLWDFRKTIADLIANEHYGQLEDTLHERAWVITRVTRSGRAFVAMHRGEKVQRSAHERDVDTEPRGE